MNQDSLKDAIFQLMTMIDKGRKKWRSVTIASKWSEILEKYQWLSFQIPMGLGNGDVFAFSLLAKPQKNQDTWVTNLGSHLTML